jgi:hypothetical protein
MKYETPQLIALMPAINAIHDHAGKPFDPPNVDSSVYEPISAYADWED